MTTRRPPRSGNTVQQLAEIHRYLRRTDRKMARLARGLEQLFEFLREQHGGRAPRPVERRPAASTESPPEI